jgi:hypothetical protein
VVSDLHQSTSRLIQIGIVLPGFQSDLCGTILFILPKLWPDEGEKDEPETSG